MNKRTLLVGLLTVLLLLPGILYAVALMPRPIQHDHDFQSNPEPTAAAESGWMLTQIYEQRVRSYVLLASGAGEKGETAVVTPIVSSRKRESATSIRLVLPLIPVQLNTAPARPFYGLHFVGLEELGQVKELGIEVILRNFEHGASSEEWVTYLDAAQTEGLRVVAWLWPEGWRWNGGEWVIDAQARLFLETVADHPALLAVYALHEPYWQGCMGCGYTTAEQQALYTAIKQIADVPVWSAVDSMSFWTGQGEETAFGPGICDYCETWYYPFRSDGSYEREELMRRIEADIATARERSPDAFIVWSMQGFAQGAPEFLRMPAAEEMRDLAQIVYGAGVDGALWYPWNFNETYSDYLSRHPELHPVIYEIYVNTVRQAAHNNQGGDDDE